MVPLALVERLLERSGEWQGNPGAGPYGFDSSTC